MKILIFDTTLRDGEQTPGVNLNAKEKLEIAKQLEKLGVDCIEAGFPVASKGDFEAVGEISKLVRTPVITALARAVKSDIDTAWEALKYASRPRIHTFIATSDIHMKHKLRMEPNEVVKRAVEMVRYAKSLCREVEFSPEDGTRSRPEFLCEVIEAVIDAGADVINIPDTVGYAVPKAFGDLIKTIKTGVPNIKNAIISVHCHNDLGLGVANSLAAIENGAVQVECTINGLGERAGNAALEEIVMALKTRKDYFRFDTGIVTEQIHRASTLVSNLTGVQIQPNKAITGANAFAHESGIHQHGMLTNRETYEIMTPESIGLKKSQMILGKHSGRHAFEEKLKELGHSGLSQETISEAFARFKDLADKKKYVLDNDIDALMSEKEVETPHVYELEYYQVSSGNNLTATSTVRLRKHGEIIEEAACGDGPVDAAFNAIDRAIAMEITLKEYFLKAVTSGKDALGEATARVSNNGKIYTGRGISTDIIEASAKAYINAINKMIMDVE